MIRHELFPFLFFFIILFEYLPFFLLNKSSIFNSWLYNRIDFPLEKSWINLNQVEGEIYFLKLNVDASLTQHRLKGIECSDSWCPHEPCGGYGWARSIPCGCVMVEALALALALQCASMGKSSIFMGLGRSYFYCSV